VTQLPIEGILLQTVRIIERLGIPYAVMGGFAARAWGLPRPTFDADIAVAVDDDSLRKLFDALAGEGYDIPPEHRTGFLDTVGAFQKAKVNLFYDRHVWHTDLFIVRSEFMHSALNRAQNAMIGQHSVRVMSPEDMIILKLIASRRKDLADIEDIIAISSTLDLQYLKGWAAKLGLAKRLAEFLPKAF